MRNYKAIIVTIGDELLIGQVIDTNSAWLGAKFNMLGIEVIEKLAISDTEEGILNGLEYVTKKADIILLTGGLGPTKDDITKNVLAKYYNTKMVFHDPTWLRIKQLFERWGKPTNDAHKEQCYMPANAEILENKMGTAPGMLIRGEDHILISMPGVPYEMKSITDEHIVPLISKNYIGNHIYHKTILTAGEGESSLAKRIEYITDEFPDYIKIAFLPNLGQVRLRITGEGTNKEKINNLVNDYVDQIVAELGVMVYGFDDTNLVSAIGELCFQKGVTLGTVESCTGGKVASMIVNQPGSSAFYQGSVVSYSNELKHSLLSVNKSTLEMNGAVSEEVVKEMVVGGISRLGVDIVVAISGVAGPTGGSESKPVGTIWMACGNESSVVTKLVKAGKNREKNIEYASNYALDMIRKYLMRN